ncbi:phosphatase PAP2 family protein [Paratractidigestivibacter sp.]|uniref:phosphatase PAP2 family protein n=1 Tax=Paratractidigestivibacter sp. TaxID=2847316 RepID=UPI002ABE65E5|nr:phosphatase PAP2 family protein [Paratractidigestivibacter sp.]
MDIDYLLLLQNLRDASGAFLPELMGIISKIAVSELPLMLICFVYWALDRQGGKRILGGFSLGLFMNGLLKLTFCVYRPWIRDARVLPYGDAKVAATGYSFPSGHSTWATGCFGGTGEWLRRQGRRALCIVCWVCVALVMFSRNFLGVHTPQDVIVGFGTTALSIFAIYKLEAWTDEDPKRDLYVMIGGLALCVAAGAFYYLKPYPLDYNADGTLLVDPLKMANDSFEGLGMLGGYVTCRFIERRGFAFDRELTMRDRAVMAVVALIPFYGMLQLFAAPLAAVVGAAAKNVIRFFAVALYAMVMVPAAMSLVAKLQKR